MQSDIFILKPYSFKMLDHTLDCNVELQLKVQLLEDCNWHVFHDVLGKVAAARDYQDFINLLTAFLFNIYVHFVERPHNQQLSVSTSNIAIFAFLKKHFTLTRPENKLD
jgi:hypothetical protein